MKADESVDADLEAAFERGRAHRKTAARQDLGHWRPELRKHTPAKLLNAAMRGRIPALLTVKRERMSASAFGFFRGAVPVMAYDLSLGPHTGIVNQLCGDAHVQNLGAYAGVDGKLIFDFNDFDETTSGPFEWDVKRMATSILLAGAEARLKPRERKSAAEAFLGAYCDLVQQLATLPVLQVARFQVRRLNAEAPIAKVLAAAERASPLRSRDKLTEASKLGRIFRSEPPVLRRITGPEKASVLASLGTYRKCLLPERRHFFDQFRPVDVAFKVVGTGSVGLYDYCVYLHGNGPEDPLFLQIKQETASAYAPYLPKSASAQKHGGQRVADGQRAMQLQSDPLLGWTSLDGRNYLVRQLNDHKATLDATTLDAEALREYSRVCGEMLARGHARSGSARLIAGYIGGGGAFKTAMMHYARGYQQQTEADWKEFVAQA